ncbi:hypothetical protein BMH30_15840, partial [Leucobacter sp. OLES1]
MTWWFALLSFATVALVVGALVRPLGDYLAWVYTSRKDWRVERGAYRLLGVDSRSEQTWQAYLRSVLLFSLVGLLLLYGM